MGQAVVALQLHYITAWQYNGGTHVWCSLTKTKKRLCACDGPVRERSRWYADLFLCCTSSSTMLQTMTSVMDGCSSRSICGRVDQNSSRAAEWSAPMTCLVKSHVGVDDQVVRGLCAQLSGLLRAFRVEVAAAPAWWDEARLVLQLSRSNCTSQPCRSSRQRTRCPRASNVPSRPGDEKTLLHGHQS